MTAIIYDGKSIAADRRLTKDERLAGTVKKIWKWSHGVWAAAGRYDDSIEFPKWLEDRDYKFKPHKNFHAIYTEGKKVYELIWTLIPMPAQIPLGIGIAGHDCELLCLLGYTAKEAAEAVKKVHTAVGGKIDVVTL